MQTDEKRTFKNQLYEQFARIGKALANPHRLELLDVLVQCERTVEALAQETGMSVANASQHLQVLRAAHLVEVRREGVSMYYRMADESIFRMWQAVRTVGEAQLAEIDRVVQTFLQDRTRLQPVGAQELLHRLSDDQIILLDVRPAEEYAAGHLPQARSMPVTELEARLAELPVDREIVAYCAAPTVYLQMRLWHFCVRVGTAPVGSNRAFPSGARLGCRSKSERSLSYENHFR